MDWGIDVDLLQNPFHMLQTHPRHGRQKTRELYEERSLSGEASTFRQALSELSNPRRRLSAELAWLPEMGPKSTTRLISLVDKNSLSVLLDARVPHAAKANLLAAGLSRLQDAKPQEVAAWILELAWEFQSVEAEKLRDAVNTDREFANLPSVKVEAIEDELVHRRRYFEQVIREALNRLESGDMVSAVNVSVKVASLNGRKHGPILVDNMVDAYEANIQERMANAESKIDQAIYSIESRAPLISGINGPFRQYMDMDELNVALDYWDTLAQPIQVSAKSRGLDHSSSFEVAHKIRRLSVSLVNEYALFLEAKQLIELNLKIFAELQGVVDQSITDLEAIEELISSSMNSFRW